MDTTVKNVYKGLEGSVRSGQSSAQRW